MLVVAEHKPRFVAPIALSWANVKPDVVCLCLQCHTRKRVVRGFLSACAGGRANAAHSRPVNSLPSLRPLIARESHVTSAKRLDSAGRDTALGRSSAETTLLDREKSTLSGVVAASPEMQAEVERSQLNLVILCAAVALICAVDRAAMSVAILPMTEAFGWTDSEKGAVASAFFFGYTATNPIAGTLASRGQAKAILSAGVVTWSIFTILTPTAANRRASAAPAARPSARRRLPRPSSRRSPSDGPLTLAAPQWSPGHPLDVPPHHGMRRGRHVPDHSGDDGQVDPALLAIEGAR